MHLQAWIDAGSQRDPVGAEGLASFVAQGLIAGGAGTRDGPEVQRALRELDATLNLEVRPDAVHLSLRCPPTSQEGCLSLLADLVIRPRFAPEALVGLRARAHARLQGLHSHPDLLLNALLRGLLLEGLPSAHPIDGRIGALGQLDAPRARDFHRDHYVRSSVVLGVLGPWDGDPEADLTAAFQELRGVPSPEPNRFGPPTISEPTLTSLPHPEPDQTWLALGGTLDLDAWDPAWPALQRFTQSDYLYQRLTEALGPMEPAPTVTLCAGSCDPLRPVIPRVPPTFTVIAGPLPTARAEVALQALLDGLHEAQNAELPEVTLREATERLHSTLRSERADPGRRLASALHAALFQTPDPLDTLPERIDALGPDSLPQALQHLDLERLRVIALSDAPQAIEARLIEGARAPRVHSGHDETGGPRLDLTDTHSWHLEPEGLFR